MLPPIGTSSATLSPARCPVARPTRTWPRAPLRWMRPLPGTSLSSKVLCKVTSTAAAASLLLAAVVHGSRVTSYQSLHPCTTRLQLLHSARPKERYLEWRSRGLASRTWRGGAHIQAGVELARSPAKCETAAWDRLA
ncbi:hypothetical protein BS78_09G215800 [Paspalum vaginatum]|nr:hypothetical protein BS78_09G215800 [Paspalum vaginatum]